MHRTGRFLGPLPLPFLFLSFFDWVGLQLVCKLVYTRFIASGTFWVWLAAAGTLAFPLYEIISQFHEFTVKSYRMIFQRICEIIPGMISA